MVAIAKSWTLLLPLLLQTVQISSYSKLLKQSTIRLLNDRQCCDELIDINRKTVISRIIDINGGEIQENKDATESVVKKWFKNILTKVYNFFFAEDGEVR